MEIITLTGAILDDLLDDIGVPVAAVGTRRDVHTVRVARDGDTVKFKIDGGMWTPPYPLADEDRRRLAARDRSWS